jgi:hypothetical protein
VVSLLFQLFNKQENESMRNFIAGLLVAGLVMSVSTPVAAQQDAQKGARKNTVQQVAEVYVCPMHPEVTGSKAGKCSKCGMALEKKVQKSAQMKKEGMKNGDKSKCGGCQEPCGDK